MQTHWRDHEETTKVRAISFFTAIGLLTGCAGIGGGFIPAEITQADPNAQKEFTYDFSLPGKSQADLWRSARNYFAEAYGDSRSVFRVLDEKDGTLIGRGATQWALATAHCATEYHIRFAAKDDKARLQYEIIEGVPAFSQCSGWSWPSQSGYKLIVESFANNAKGLELALQGKGSKSKLKDF